MVLLLWQPHYDMKQVSEESSFIVSTLLKNEINTHEDGSFIVSTLLKNETSA